MAEFETRLAARPPVYLPMGMPEPDGHAAAFGLDLLKVDHICDHAAARFGGIVAPSQGYRIDETGYAAADRERGVDVLGVGAAYPGLTRTELHHLP